MRNLDEQAQVYFESNRPAIMQRQGLGSRDLENEQRSCMAGRTASRDSAGVGCKPSIRAKVAGASERKHVVDVWPASCFKSASMSRPLSRRALKLNLIRCHRVLRIQWWRLLALPIDDDERQKDDSSSDPVCNTRSLRIYDHLANDGERYRETEPNSNKER